MLTSPTHLRDTLLELDTDLGGLPGRRVALLGFHDANPTRIADNVRALCETPGWTVIDLRQTAVRLPERLPKALAAAKLALMLNVAAPLPTDVSLLIRALRDAHDAVVWTDGTRCPLPATRMLYVIAAGARSHDQLPPQLKAIDFMTFG